MSGDDEVLQAVLFVFPWENGSKQVHLTHPTAWLCWLVLPEWFLRVGYLVLA